MQQFSHCQVFIGTNHSNWINYLIKFFSKFKDDILMFFEKNDLTVLSSTYLWSWFLVNLCKMMISQGVFFIFLDFDFLGCQGGKIAKMALNDKTFCLSHSVFQEPFLKWLCFLAYIFKMLISPAFFSFF